MLVSEAWPLFLHDFVHLYGRAKSTATHYSTAKNNYQNYIGDIEVDVIAPTLAGWAEHLSKSLGQGTANVYLDSMSSFGKWARKRGLTNEDWFDGIKRKDPEAPIPKALRWTEALACADNCYGLRLSMRDRAFILFLIYTGARASEATSFPAHNLDLLDKKVVFTNTKGRMARVVYFGDKFKKELDLYLEWRFKMWPESYWLFPTRSGDQMSVEDAQSIPLKYQLGVTLHQFRHTFITQVLKQTKNLKLAQELAGHKSILTTSRYLRIWDSEKQDAAVAIEGDESQPVDKRGKRK